MKLVVLAFLLALSVAAVQNNAVFYDIRTPTGYSFGFQQSDGQSHEAQGELKNQGREDESLAVRGRYSWVAPDGQRYTIRYVADDNGYQPEVEEGPGLSGAAVASLLG